MDRGMAELDQSRYMDRRVSAMVVSLVHLYGRSLLRPDGTCRDPRRIAGDRARQRPHCAAVDAQSVDLSDSRTRPTSRCSWLNRREAHPLSAGRREIDRYRNSMSELVDADGKPSRHGASRFAPATVAKRLSAVRSFYAYLVDRGAIRWSLQVSWPRRTHAGLTVKPPAARQHVAPQPRPRLRSRSKTFWISSPGVTPS
jgi:hypothetical protein